MLPSNTAIRDVQSLNGENDAALTPTPGARSQQRVNPCRVRPTSSVIWRSGSQKTQRWREMDSNHRSPKGPVFVAEGELRNRTGAAKKGCFLYGTDGSNPSPSSGESGTNCSGGGLRWSPAAIHAPHSAVMMSSAIPSEKNSCSGSLLMLVKGRTAMDGLSGRGNAAGGAVGNSGAAAGPMR